MVHVALCMYGSIRTFTSPKLRDHYERFFVPSLAKDSVDVYVVLIRDPVCSNPCSRSTPMSPCDDVNVEQMVHHLFRNFQIKHIEIRDKSDGIPTNQQLGGIDYVFRMARNNHDYDRYMRVRPDFFGLAVLNYWTTRKTRSLLRPSRTVSARTCFSSCLGKCTKPGGLWTPGRCWNRIYAYPSIRVCSIMHATWSSNTKTSRALWCETKTKSSLGNETVCARRDELVNDKLKKMNYSKFVNKKILFHWNACLGHHSGASGILRFNRRTCWMLLERFYRVLFDSILQNIRIDSCQGLS